MLTEYLAEERKKKVQVYLNLKPTWRCYTVLDDYYKAAVGQVVR